MTPAEPSWTRPAHGVRRILNNAADTALATRHAEAWYVATIEIVDGIPTQVWVPRALTPEEITAASATAITATLTTDMAADSAVIEAAIAALATLLADRATPGSYRSVLGLGTDPAGLTSLRAWRSQTNANIVTAASLKGLADLLISLVQLDIVQAPRDAPPRTAGAPAIPRPDRRPVVG